MNKYEELFAQYQLGMSDEEVKNAVKELIEKHAAENNNVEVWKQCLSQIDLTTLNGDDTVEKVEKMARRVNGFQSSLVCLT